MVLFLNYRNRTDILRQNCKRERVDKGKMRREGRKFMLEYNCIQGVNNNGIVEIMHRTFNYVDARLINHGRRVAYIVSRMLNKQKGYSQKQQRDICFLAMLHDIGAYKTEEIDKMLEFETINVWEHAIYGYLFLKYFSPLEQLAEAVLYHHTNWEQLRKIKNIEIEIKELAQILNIADRADVFFENSASNMERFAAYLKTVENIKFSLTSIQLFLDAEIQFPIENQIETDKEFNLTLEKVPLITSEIQKYLNMMISAIDFRSYYTVTHTIAATSISEQLAVLSGMNQREKEEIIWGAMLHDLGKIGIPVKILESNTRLNEEEMTMMKRHVEITEKILENDVSLVIKQIALRHHEKLDGSGYPKGLCAKELTKSERIVAIADIISALCGKRSYKQEYPKEEVISIITKMSEEGLIDRAIVAIFVENYDKIMEQNKKNCEPVIKLYQTISQEYEQLKQFFIL